MAITTFATLDMDKDKFVQELVAECSEVLKSNPGNRCAKYCKEYLESSEGKNLDAKGECMKHHPIEAFIQRFLSRSHFIALVSIQNRFDDLLQVCQNGHG